MDSSKSEPMEGELDSSFVAGANFVVGKEEPVGYVTKVRGLLLPVSSIGGREGIFTGPSKCILTC